MRGIMGDKLIRINGLFGSYTSEIKLDSRCSILIGANGVGKSTILHIIRNILDLNFLELARYDFNSIDLVAGDSRLRISYNDLFPSLKDFLYVMKEHTDTTTFIQSSVGDESIYSIMSEALGKVDKSSGRSNYQKYLSSCYFKKPVLRETSRIISTITSIFLIADDPNEIINRTLGSMPVHLRLSRSEELV